MNKEMKEKYYYSPDRLNCKKNHHYTECPEEDICPFAFCDTCKIDYISLEYLGEFESANLELEE